jgi:hypothetical protein
MALLAATKKTGELRVVGGRIDGRVHLDAGRVVSAEVGRADSFVDAVFELLRLTSGKFSFDADKAPADPADPVDVEPLLLEAQARLTEWRGIEAVVPSMDHGVALVADLTDPHVTLAADQWRIVVAVAGVGCVHEAADRLGLGEYTVCKALRELVESGVVEITDPPAPKPAAKPAPKPAAKVEPAPEPEPEPEVVAEAVPEPEPVAEVAEKPKEAKPAASTPAPAKPVIEPERKPEAAVGKASVQALTTTDPTSPIPPGQEPPAKPKKAAARVDEPVPSPAPSPVPSPVPSPRMTPVDAAQAKQLVSQLAAMGTEKPPTPVAKAAPKADQPDAPKTDAPKTDAPKADAPKADAPKAQAPEAPAAEAEAEAVPAAEGGEAEEPLNRGLLLKFLSSVRQ